MRLFSVRYSYHVPIHNDYPLLSILMGHSTPAMTRYKYGTLRPRAVAEQWWALTLVQNSDLRS